MTISRACLHSTTRWVLAWFVLTLAAAVVAPLFSPLEWQQVCHADVEPFWINADGQPWDSGAGDHALHCPMCMAANGPPPDVDIFSSGVVAVSAAPAWPRIPCVAPKFESLSWQARAPPLV